MYQAIELKRIHERRDYIVDIVFAHRNKAYRGIIKNVSAGGAYIYTNTVNQFKTGDSVTVSIPFTTGNRHVKRDGRIVWKNDEGFAIAFI